MSDIKISLMYLIKYHIAYIQNGWVKMIKISDHKVDSNLYKIQMNSFDCFEDEKDTCL